jgi:hypothetical protein
MNTQPVVLLAAPQEKNLSKRQQQFMSALQKRIRSEGIRLEIDGRDFQGLKERHGLVRRCQGVFVVVLAQWSAQRLYRDEDKSLIVPSEFTHVATALAVAARKPLLVLRDKSVAQRGSLKEGYVKLVVAAPPRLNRSGSIHRPFKTLFRNG